MTWPRLPRSGYWIIGAAIAISGAVVAHLLGDQVGEVYRVPVWLAGAAMVFVGLAVVSLGTKARSPDEGDDGAGEGNRTLA